MLAAEEYTMANWGRTPVALVCFGLAGFALLHPVGWAALMAYCLLHGTNELRCLSGREYHETFVKLYWLVFATGLGLMTALRFADNGWKDILIVNGACIVSDIAANLIGKNFSSSWRPFPSISPNKTIVGFVAGLVGGVLYFIFVADRFEGGHWHHDGFKLWFIAALVTATAIGGDLLGSTVKRAVGVKDFSRKLGSHGGIVDRLDSHIVAFPTYVVYSALL